jgi:hypothetical protein
MAYENKKELAMSILYIISTLIFLIIGRIISNIRNFVRRPKEIINWIVNKIKCVKK